MPTIKTASRNSRGPKGPYADGNDNVYTIIYDGNPEAWKSANPMTPASWSEQDAAGAPASVALGGAQLNGVWQDGTVLHNVQYTNGGVVEYSSFRTSDHASADTWDITDETVEDPANNPSQGAALCVVRSGGNVVVGYNGDTDKIMGADYDRVDYRIRTGVATYGAVTNIAGDGVEANFQLRGIGLGESDNVYFSYLDSAGDISASRLNSSNSLASIGTIHTGNNTQTDNGSIIEYYDDAGVEVMSWSYSFATNDLRTRQTRDETLQTELSLSGSTFDQWNCLAADGTDLYCAFDAGGTQDDVDYQKSADGGAWGSQAEIDAATDPQTIAVRVIDHGGGKVLGLVYFDDSTADFHIYEEASIAAAPAVNAGKRLMMVS